MSDIRQDFQQLIGDFGLYVPRPGDSSSDNGALFTTEYYLILQRLNLLSSEDKDRYHALMSQCLTLGGLPLRKPGDNSLDGPDNMIALAVGSKAFSCDFAERIIKYGKTTFPHYVYNQPNPGKFTFSAWLGRQVGLIGFVKMCAGQKANIIERLALYVGFYITSRLPKESTSDKLLAHIMIEQLPNTIGARFVKRQWNSYIKKMYGGVGGLTAIYFSSPNSPFAKWWV